jgi:hypothetical protein
MAALLLVMEKYAVQGWLLGNTPRRFAGLAALVAGGGGSYFLCLYFFGVFNKESLKALFPKRKKQATMTGNGALE